MMIGMFAFSCTVCLSVLQNVCLLVPALIHVILILPLEITTVMYTCIRTLITSASSTTTPASSKQVIVVSVSEPH